MWKPIRKHFKVAFVWGIVCLLTIDTATACRFLGRRRACRSECYVVCEPVCCEVVNDCCSGEVIGGGKQGAESGEAKSDEIPPEAPKYDEPMSPADRAPQFEDRPMQSAKPLQDVEPGVAPQQPAQPMPAQPAPAAPVDDLFGDTPQPAAPAKPQPAPAVPEAPPDDLFGDAPKPVEKPAAPAPAPTQPAPAQPAPAQPAPAKPVDDLFGEAPAAPAPAPAEPAVPAAKSVDDLFGEPAPAPAKPAAPAPKTDAVDDLFGGEAKPDAPAAPPAKQPAKPVDDPFGAKVKATKELLVMRTWVDNTGTFTVQGKLVEIFDGNVRLLKDNGRTCTVPMRRLSDADAQYVHMIASTLGTGTLIQLASR